MLLLALPKLKIVAFHCFQNSRSIASIAFKLELFKSLYRDSEANDRADLKLRIKKTCC